MDFFSSFREAGAGRRGVLRGVVLAAGAALFVIGMSGCLSPKPLTERPSPEAYVLPDVPLERWGDNTCGAGALSAVMRHHGRSVVEDELIPLLPTGRNGGVVSIDLLIAARRYGFEAQLVRGNEEMIRSTIESGHPVITMIRVADLPGVNRDLFHYLVIDGYDPVKKLYRAQFGDARARWIALESLDRQWSATDYATLFVVPGDGDDAPVTASAGLKRAVLLEEQGKDEEAARMYQAIVAASPDNALAWLNLGNVQHRLHDATSAEESYRRALDLAPGDRDVMNNLAWLLVSERRNLEEAELLARRASLQMGTDAFLYLDTLGEVLRVQGRCDEAIEQFETALFAVPAEQTEFRASILGNLERARRDCNTDESVPAFD